MGNSLSPYNIDPCYLSYQFYSISDKIENYRSSVTFMMLRIVISEKLSHWTKIPFFIIDYWILGNCIIY